MMLRYMFRVIGKSMILKNLRTQTLKVLNNVDLFVYKMTCDASGAIEQKLSKNSI